MSVDAKLLDPTSAALIAVADTAFADKTFGGVQTLSAAASDAIIRAQGTLATGVHLFCTIKSPRAVNVGAVQVSTPLVLNASTIAGGVDSALPIVLSETISTVGTVDIYANNLSGAPYACGFGTSRSAISAAISFGPDEAPSDTKTVSADDLAYTAALSAFPIETFTANSTLDVYTATDVLLFQSETTLAVGTYPIVTLLQAAVKHADQVSIGTPVGILSVGVNTSLPLSLSAEVVNSGTIVINATNSTGGDLVTGNPGIGTVAAVVSLGVSP